MIGLCMHMTMNSWSLCIVMFISCNEVPCCIGIKFSLAAIAACQGHP